MAFALHLASPQKTAPLKKTTASSVHIRHTHKKTFRAANSVQFKRHDRLRTDDRTLWRIQSGYVRTFTWSLEGDPIPLGFWSVGDIVGEAIAQVSPCGAQCLSPVIAEPLGSTYAFSQSTVLAQVKQSNELLKIVHCKQTEQSLLQLLCWLAKRFGQPTDKGLAVPVKLIHQDIADTIGATRVTVTRLLKKLERDGKIQWSAREKIVYKATYSQFVIDTDCSP